MDEKLQKVLASAGLGSRREMERWIEEGRIEVNNKTATIGDRVKTTDRIKVDGRFINLPDTTQHRVIVYHKPVGEVCTRHDPEGRDTIFMNLPKTRRSRWISVGRLDINTSGLLLLTTDGELANRLMHPSHEVEREYAVRVLGQVSPEVIEALQSGVELEDGEAHFEKVTDSGGQGANRWYNVILKEGRNREVRRLWEHFGFAVSRLMRTRYGNIRLERDVRPGKWKDLTPGQIKELYQMVRLDLPQHDSPPSSGKYKKSATRKKYSGKKKKKSSWPGNKK